MLRTTPIRQFTNDLAKRWTCDDYFDLVVWYEPDGAIYGFQLSYGSEHSLTLKWTRTGGYLHAWVDEGSSWFNSSPVMTRVAEFSFHEVHAEFIQRTTEFDPELRDFINYHIMTFGLKRQSR